MKILERFGQWIISLFFLLATWCFWAFIHPELLSYNEQLQMFLFKWNYLTERISVAGGVADYISEFIVQFYYWPAIGGFILALLLTLLQRLLWSVAKGLGVRSYVYPLSFIPVAALMAFLVNENALLSFAVSIVISIAAGRLWMCINNTLFRTITLLVLTPLLYWAAGPISIILLGIILSCYSTDGKTTRLATITNCIGYLVLFIGSALLAYNQFPYELSRLFCGINYFRYPDVYPYTLITTATVTLLYTPLMTAIGRKGYEGKSYSLWLVASYALGLVSFMAVPYCSDKKQLDAIEYDYLVRTGRWDDIIKKAEKENPESPIGVSCLNLALYNRGELCDRLFEFYQNGSEGLFPRFQRDFTTPLPTAEIFYQLGMVNSSQRYMFEAQEAIPNYRRSGRMTKRLAETNLINGKYDVAKKYLRQLQSTLCYSTWAEQTLELIGSEKAINEHPIYGQMRKKRYSEDFLFSDDEMDQMMGLLFVKDKSNRMAFEYLLCSELLDCNMQRFMQYFQLIQYVDYNSLPKAFQEALIFNWTQTHNSLEGMPAGIDSMVRSGMIEYINIFKSNPNSPALREGVYGSTFWGYFTRNNDKMQNNNTQPTGSQQ